MEIRFDIDTDSLTVSDMLLVEDAQEGKRPFHSMTALMAKHMVDGEGQSLGMERALDSLGQLKISDFTAAAKLFGEAIQRKAIPPEKSGS